MKKILIFAALSMTCVCACPAAVRDGGAVSRQKSSGGVATATTQTQQRVNTEPRNTSRAAARGTVVMPASAVRTSIAASGVSPRANAVSRDANTSTAPARSAVNQTSAVARTSVPARRTPSSPRVAATTARVASSVVARAATDAATPQTSQTRTGAEYEQCKTAFFTCMDQFCQLKNDEYRRCSCSDRVVDLGAARDTLQDAGEQLTVFTENLDVVGMTAAQAAAMRTESEGEFALTSDSSASKALLQAIMNSIRGEDSNVGGKFSGLNSIDLSFDTGVFGNIDAGQAIAKYNGQNLYSAVFPQCRAAVRENCNDASLQRAITAYQMAIEQDCNTVQTAIEKKQKEMKAAVREGSAMLDLARVENRQKHNSSDFTTCLNEVEAAVLSEEVCGAGYHKCLDNGEFIDVATGAPITGVSNFADLAKMLTFDVGVDAASQQLSKINSNRTFVSNFENRAKKFAAPALDKCTEIADEVWAQYLDKALLDIFYAQQSKVNEIKQGCFDFVSSCYMNGDKSLTEAMKELIGDSSTLVQPDKIVLNAEMCTDYVESCNTLFANEGAGNIVQDYVENMQNADTVTACRAVAKQCFDKFGGTGYLNFYYPYSGLTQYGTGTMPDWFSLYDITLKDTCDANEMMLGTVSGTGANSLCATYKSQCAKQLTKVSACNDQKLIEEVFGGLDSIEVEFQLENFVVTTPDDTDAVSKYGLYSDDVFQHRHLRPTGVATEIYNQIIDILQTQCMGLQGKFMPYQEITSNTYNIGNLCLFNANVVDDKASAVQNKYKDLAKLYSLGANEDVCPRDYGLQVDVQSWGTCNCWENGGRRSKWGTTAKCMSVVPTTQTYDEDVGCSTGDTAPAPGDVSKSMTGNWCIIQEISGDGEICPLDGVVDNNNCLDSNGNVITGLPEMSKIN